MMRFLVSDIFSLVGFRRNSSKHLNALKYVQRCLFQKAAVLVSMEKQTTTCRKYEEIRRDNLTFLLNKKLNYSSTSTGSTSKLQDLDASKLIIKKKEGNPTPLPELSSLLFGKFFSDHMLEIDWTADYGWEVPHILPFHNLSLHPACTSLHYGLEVFEGLKGFRDNEGRICIFRPMMNMYRFSKSARRMALPTFNEKELLNLIKQLIKVDEFFVPREEGYSIYIRPCLISTQPTLGVGPAHHAKLFVTLNTCGPYFPHGYKPIKVLADPMFSRSFPGGVGDCKAGGNYGPTIYPNNLAAEKKFNQMIWLHKVVDDYEITECGAMNLFLFWINHKGEKELITASLEENLILPGVVRDSILKIAREYGEFKVTEGKILMRKDFITAYNENRIIEVFGSGTAVVVCSIEELEFENKKYFIKINEKNGAGDLAYRLLKDLFDIQYGRKKVYNENGESWCTYID